MKRMIAAVLCAVLLMGLFGCATEPENTLADTYLQVAQAHVADGNTELAIQALEQGLSVAEDPRLRAMLEELKATPTTETTTAATEAAAETTALTSSYPIQINMEDLLSANILGDTFFSAYQNGTLGEWMFLYVHNSSDPETLYTSLWYDAQLGQMTYYGILYQQAEAAGWGDIWVELVNGGTGASINRLDFSAYIGSWEDSWSQRAHMTIEEQGDGCHVVISWSSSASESTTWDMIAYPAEDGSLHSDNCTKTITYYDNSGSSQTETKYTNGEIILSLMDDGIHWIQEPEGTGANCVFVKNG